MSTISKYEISSLKKGLQILDLLKEEHCLKLAEISERLELNKTTAFRLLHTLEEMDYIIKIDRLYELHPRLLASGHDNGQGQAFEWSKLRALYQLGVKVERNVYVGTLDGTSLIEQQVYNARTKQMINQSIGSSPVHQSALGKALIANLGQSEQLDLFSHLSLTKATDQTFTDSVLFLHHLQAIQQQQYATDYEEFSDGLHCIACPIFYKNKVIASFSIADTAENMPKKTLRGLVPAMIETSKSITKELNTYHKYK
ncbi:Pectin degradation repressor protein KdgR [compost metagenome]